jgi:hypothetical protein
MNPQGRMSPRRGNQRLSLHLIVVGRIYWITWVIMAHHPPPTTTTGTKTLKAVSISIPLPQQPPPFRPFLLSPPRKCPLLPGNFPLQSPPRGTSRTIIPRQSVRRPRRGPRKDTFPRKVMARQRVIPFGQSACRHSRLSRRTRNPSQRAPRSSRNGRNQGVRPLPGKNCRMMGMKISSREMKVNSPKK